MLSGSDFTAAQQAAWGAVTVIADRFKSADKYVFSLPMWNFSIPYKLKHYIDLLVQPGLTFSFSPDKGYSGLVTGKSAVAIYARAGAYGPGTGAEAYDDQSRYLKQVLGFIGITAVKGRLRRADRDEGRRRGRGEETGRGAGGDVLSAPDEEAARNWPETEDRVK